MNYEEAKYYLENVASAGTVLGLEPIKALLELLGNPQDSLKFVHIAGTNGKGSTLAFISTILKEAGYKVGRYVSPTVVCYEERIQINGEYISHDDLADIATKVIRAAESLEKTRGFMPSVFEIETAMAFTYFLRSGCDIVALETGMGGIGDATNIVTTTEISVIASISMDHMNFLGNTLSEIATQKAGIIKPGRPVVSILQDTDAMKVITSTAEDKGCELTIADPGNISNVRTGDLTLDFDYKGSEEDFKDLASSLVGMYQKDNAALAIEAILALRRLGYNIPTDCIYKGLAGTVWMGRFTEIHKNPRIIIDGAHNEAAARRLAETLQIYFTNKRITYIMGVLKDKEYGKILDIMMPFADKVFTIAPNNPRALSAEELATEIKLRGVFASPAPSVKEALHMAVESSRKDSVILSFGSLYYLGEMIQAVNEL